MAHLQYIDELIREYLVFKGFSNTLKAFDAELKIDKDKGFRVDRVVEQLVQYVNSYDLASLRELWSHLDQKMFSKLEHDFLPGVRKLESSLFKFYLINAISNNKSDKVTDFFIKLTPDLQGLPEWKEWFMLPYVKNPEEVNPFSVHFTKQWQDTLLVSLHNFLSIIYQAMPLPTLSRFEEDATRLRYLQEENDMLKHKVATLSQCSSTAPDTVPPMDIMDDFYIIAQENPNIDNQNRSLKSLIKTIGGGLPTSPILGRKPPPQDEQSGVQRQSQQSSKHRATQPGWIKHISGEGVPKRSLSLDSRSRRTRDSSQENLERKSVRKDNFLLLSQEKLTEHKASVTQCRFNHDGTIVASCDAGGVMKVWSPVPVPRVLATGKYEATLTALTWMQKNDKQILVGGSNGPHSVLRLFDLNENKVIYQIGDDSGSEFMSTRFMNTKILSLCSSPTENKAICTTIDLTGGRVIIVDNNSGRIISTITLESDKSSRIFSDCSVFNHNGNLIYIGCADGTVRTYDLRYTKCLESLECHSSPVVAMGVTSDQTTCFSLGHDHRLCRNNLTQAGEAQWTSYIPSKCFITQHGNQSFALHQTGSHVLSTCNNFGANIFQVTSDGLQSVLQLGGHKAQIVACDWAIANQCSTCLSASKDGKIIISTILTP